MSQLHWTGLHDRYRRPIAVGDLLRIHHFRAAKSRRDVWMYKKVLLRLGKPYGYDLVQLGQRTTDECHCYPLDTDNAAQSEILDGPCDRSKDGVLVCWWERPKVKQEATP